MLLNRRAQPTRAEVTSDHEVVTALLEGDEVTFLSLVRRHHRAMIQLARLHLRSEALAEDVAQDCWLLVLARLRQWTGRGSLRSWIFAIVANQARSRAVREARTIPTSMLEPHDADRHTEEVFACGGCQWATIAPGDPWRQDSVERQEVLDTVWRAIEELPPRQRAVIGLRDISGCDGSEASAALCVSEANQRVLLHRARTKVRKAVEEYLRS